MIRSYGVESGVLKSIGLKFRHQSDTTTFLMLVNQHAASFSGNGSHRQFQLVSAVAAKRSEHITRETLGVNPKQGGRRARWIAPRITQDQHDGRFWVAPAKVVALEPEHAKYSPPRRQRRNRKPLNPACLVRSLHTRFV